MFEPLPSSYISLVWPLLLADMACWWRLMDCVDYLSGCGPSTCSLIICLWYFIFRRCMVGHLLFSLWSVLSGSSWALLIVLSLIFLSHFMNALRALPCALFRLYPSSGRSSSPREIHGLVERLVRAFLFGTGWFTQHLCHIYAWRTAWPAQGSCRNRQAWFYCRRDCFQSLDRKCRSEVLANSHPSSLQLPAVAGPVVARSQQRRRDKFSF